MGKVTGNGKQGGVDRKDRLTARLVPLSTLLLVIAITIGILYFYRQYPDRIEALEAYGYPGAFLISLILNATVILPVGNILILSALGAILPSAVGVGLAGGAGAAIGETTGYLAGYSGRGIVENHQIYARVESWMRRWGAPTIFVFSALPFVFDLAGIAAGVLRFPFWKFFLLCWLGRSLLYIAAALAGAWGWEAVLQWLG